MSATSDALAILERTPKHHWGQGGRLCLLAAATLQDRSGPTWPVVRSVDIARVVGLAKSTVERTMREWAAEGVVGIIYTSAGVQALATGRNAKRLPRGARRIGYTLGGAA